MSGQLKRLESEQAELLKTYDKHLAGVESQLSQNKTVFAERAYRCFFETSTTTTTKEASPAAKVFGQFRCGHRTKAGQKEEDPEVIGRTNTKSCRS